MTKKADISNTPMSGVLDSYHRAIAFPWEKSGGRAIYWAMDVGAGETEWTCWRALFVAFDENDTVIAATRKRLSGKRSLHSQLYSWAEEQEAASGRIDPRAFSSKGP